ncbi:uncharacterized protein LOC115919169 [Strongylocentrotus purpuratus]|uniref:Integrase catalytic domain-containing protein n=1 Tax=Strongylocentrotus purpuratus TaxID=7668 RepID=A0A7M7MXZ8_STRPU|nr:uncharacterized protein LOC115919169 [Strongylocentrotus purpuratus]
MDDALKDKPSEKARESPSYSQSEGQIREASMEISRQKEERDEVTALKRSCQGYVGNLAKQYKELEVMMSSYDNLNAARRKYGQLKGTFLLYQHKYSEYYKRLSKDDKATSKEQFESHESNKAEFDGRMMEWDAEATKRQSPTTELDEAGADKVSVRSSASRRSRSSKRSSTSSSSSARLRDAKVRAELARLKKEQLVRAQELKREQLKLDEQLSTMKIDNEITNAEAEARLIEEEIFDEGNSVKDPQVKNEVLDVHVSEYNKPVHKFGLNPNAPVWEECKLNATNDVSCKSNVQDLNMSQMFHAINLAVHLPKPDLSTFGGNPIEYRSFINSFEVNIADKVTDDRARLTYLVQYCSGKARSSIENCVMMAPSEGYAEARRILREQFGQPYVVATAHMKKVLNRAPLRPNDGTAMWDLCRDMQRCQMVLGQMGYTADMNSSDNLLHIQQLLPVHLQSQWAIKAHQMMEGSTVPSFEHMAKFIENSAKLANNMFGQNIGRSSSVKVDKSGGRPKPDTRRTTLTTQGKGEYKTLRQDRQPAKGCPCCTRQHDLKECGIFKEKSFEERRKTVRKVGLCDNCFLPHHMAMGCMDRSNCEEKGCTRKHHTLLHPPSWEKATQPQYRSKEDNPRGPRDSSGAGNSVNTNHAIAEDNENVQGQCNSTFSTRRKVCLRVVPVKVAGNNKELETWALLDEGSDVSLCDERLVEELGVQGAHKEFQLTTINKAGLRRKGLEVSLTVKNVSDGESIDLPKVWTVDKLPISKSCIPTDEDLNRWPHLRGVHLPRIDEGEVRLLIGSDTPEAFWVIDQRRGKRKEPYAVRSLLGWTVMGPTMTSAPDAPYSVNFTKHEERLEQQLQRFWEVDHAFRDERLADSVEDKRARKTMDETVGMVDGHYQVGLPWRKYPPSLPNNKKMAESRLQSLKKRLGNDKILHTQYMTTMEGYITKGFAQEVNGQGDEVVWYLPHHPVRHPMKPNKVRIVFDCAAKFCNGSLNDQLLSGPDFTNSLVGVLLRFRQERIALVADIEGMFHQVRVTPRDAGALRFLWWDNGDLDKTPKEYQMLVHLFGATSSPSCAGFALRKTVEDNQQDFDPEVSQTVLENFYVDDCLKSISSREEGKRLVSQLCEILKRGGFRLTKWVSNDREVLSAVPSTERAASVVDLDFDHLPIERTLGVLWDMNSDSFGFKVSPKDVPTTRRGLLSATSSLYDPLGFVAPFSLNAKILLQDLCAQGLGWDETVGKDELQRWTSWLSELPELSSVKIDRCFKPTGFVDPSYDLHIFCDASERAYAACAYLRVTDTDDRIHCAFVMGKTRLCPLKKMSVPRLELSAAALGVKLGQTIKEELRLPLRNTTYWTDSTSVLQYISNESRRFQTFVANRVAKIQSMSERSQWRHVSTHANPADDGSRGMPAGKLARWLQGPSFLVKEECEWPVSPPSLVKTDTATLDLLDPEVKKKQVFATMSEDILERLMAKYSTWQRLKRGVAWILRYKTYLKLRVSRGIASLKKGDLTLEELNAAEREVIKHVQRQAFPIATNDKGNNGRLQQASTLSKLTPVMKDGLLRVGGRLTKAPISDEMKHPLILPHDHHVTKLLVMYYHQEVGHSGAGMTWTALRDRYWILKGGATVRRVIGNCFQCKKRNSARGRQFMADLPVERVTPDHPPFTNTGVDFFGPFYVKQGRSEVKRYGCVFTCLATRAVHIEVANSLETDSFINALRRFINRRGSPEKILSDNGTNFKGAYRELKEGLDKLNSKKVDLFLMQKGIAWEFNPPGASHMGGAWERMIRSIRRILGSLLKQQLVNDETLTTLMTEVEAILNARPLTQLSLDPRDEEPLTPNHLLLLRKNPSLPPGTFTKEDSYLQRRWRQVQFLANQFWKRWIKEYLPLLQQRQKWTRVERNFQTDDLVLVADDSSPRGKWPLGKVTATYPDRHGRVRQVEVRVGSKYYKRPISKLCLLEAGKDTAQ